MRGYSFGTNDLPQTTFGFSRDDVNKVVPTVARRPSYAKLT